MFVFYGIPTIVGYLMPNPFLYNKLFYFKQFKYTVELSKTVLLQVSKFSISMQFISIWPIDRNLSSVTTLGQSGSWSDGNEAIPQSSSITGTSESDCLVSYPGHSVGGLALCRNAVGVFYSPSQLCNLNLGFSFS